MGDSYLLNINGTFYDTNLGASFAVKERNMSAASHNQVRMHRYKLLHRSFVGFGVRIERPDMINLGQQRATP